MTDDLISRKAAIEAITKIRDAQAAKQAYGWEFEYNGFNHAIQALPLPSAQPERKTGKWIRCDYDKWANGAHKCSECNGGYHLPYEKFTINWNFCPNCGAKMEEEE